MLPSDDPLTTTFLTPLCLCEHASEGVAPELLEKLGEMSTQAVVDALWVMGYPQNQVT